MSRSSSKTSKEVAEGAKAESASSSASEDDNDLEDTGREETPDLYRNSALGMYGGVGPGYISALIIISKLFAAGNG